jgi:uncharacterized protein YqgC (DUF456 family)
MELLWWLIAILLMAAGLLGTVLPIFPGTTIILFAAVLHRIMLGPEKSIGWRAIAALVLLTLISYALDFASGYWGARRFGASRWGMLGATIGAVIGIFFGIIGLFVGPVIGAIAAEFVAGKKMIDAGRAGWGSLLGTLGGLIGKLFIALAMIVIFLMTAPSPI